MKTLDETQQRRTIRLRPAAPLFEQDPLFPALDSPLPPARDDTRPAPRVAGDELFPDEQPQRPVLTIAARCAVHDLPIQIPAAGPRLCGDCLADLASARAHVERVLEAAPDHPAALRFLGVARFKLGRQDEGIALLRQAADAFLAAQTAADDATLTRWRKAEALLSNPPAGFWETWQKHTAAQTPLGAILAAHEALERLQAWAVGAVTELEAAK